MPQTKVHEGTPKRQFLKIAEIPKSHKGAKQIPEEWVKAVQSIPIGSAILETDVTMLTVRNRIKRLQEMGILDNTFYCTSRTIDKKTSIYIAHSDKPVE